MTLRKLRATAPTLPQPSAAELYGRTWMLDGYDAPDYVTVLAVLEANRFLHTVYVERTGTQS